MVTSRAVLIVGFVVVLIAYFQSRKTSALSLAQCGGEEKVRSAVQCNCKDCPAKSAISMMEEAGQEQEAQEQEAQEQDSVQEPTRMKRLARTAYFQ